MRGCPLVLALACSLGGGSATPAGAYALTAIRTRLTTEFLGTRWKTLSQPISFMLNDGPASMLPNLLGDSLPTAAVREGIQTWAFAPMGMTLAGTSSRTSVGLDGVNLISLANTAENRDLVGNNIAVTQFWLNAHGNLPYWPMRQRRTSSSTPRCRSRRTDGPKRLISRRSSPMSWATRSAWTIRPSRPRPCGRTAIRARRGTARRTPTTWRPCRRPTARSATQPTARSAAACWQPETCGSRRDSGRDRRAGRGALRRFHRARRELHALLAAAFPVIRSCRDARTLRLDDGVVQRRLLSQRLARLSHGFPRRQQLAHARAGGARGDAVAANPIRVSAQRPRLAIQVLGSAPDGQNFTQFGLQALTLKPGTSTYLLVAARS